MLSPVPDLQPANGVRPAGAELVADCGQPNFPFGPGLAALLIAAQVMLALSTGDGPVRVRDARRVPDLVRQIVRRADR